MSIAILARKVKGSRGASTRSHWTLATTKSGKCPTACGGGAPAKQKSFRQLAKQKANLRTIQWKPTANLTLSEHTYKLKLKNLCDTSNNRVKPCNNHGCKCQCSRLIGNAVCCNVHKDVKILSISENLPNIINKKTCFIGNLTTCPQCIEAVPINPCTC